MSNLLRWERRPDGEHDGRPVYDYVDKLGDVTFFITWSTDAGFGYSVFDHATEKYLTPRGGIHWCRTLKFCKAECEKIVQSQSDLRRLGEQRCKAEKH